MSNELTRNPGRFDEVIHIIDNARSRAMKAVNAELIQMYWEIGAYVSGRVKDGGWGKSVVADFSEFLQAHYPGTKGFSAQNIWRMKQFYETYCDNEKLSPLVREIPWTSNLLIMTGCKTDEAREFYLRLCIANRYTKRELDRQIGSMLYERTMISHEKHKDLLVGNGGLAALRDSYVFEFLDLEEPYKEKDLRRQIVSHLKDFILEFGHDFTFVGEEYRVQVGNTDFFIDLILFTANVQAPPNYLLAQKNGYKNIRFKNSKMMIRSLLTRTTPMPQGEKRTTSSLCYSSSILVCFSPVNENFF